MHEKGLDLSNKEEILSQIESDLEGLNKKQTFNQSLYKMGKDSAVSGVVIAGFLFATHFGLSAMYDDTSYREAQKKMDQGTLVVPEEIYADYQEACIRSELAGEDDLTLSDMSQDEVLSLKDEYNSQLVECSDEEYSNNMNVQSQYLETMNRPSWAFNTGLAFLASSGMYLGLGGYMAARRRKTQKNIDRKNRDHDLLG